MKHPIIKSVGVAAAVALALSACSSGGSTTPTSSAAAGATSAAAAAPVTLSLAGWSLSTTPEFQTLADAFHAAHPNVTVNLKEYDATNYDTQMTADLAAGSAPDLYILKNLKNFFTYQDGGQLMDVSDVASQLNKSTSGLSAYQVAGKTYAVPYRQDSWYLYYNKDLFDKAGVSYPDGKWTWDDYAAAAKKLTAGLAGATSRVPTSTAGSRPCRASPTRRPLVPTSSPASSTTSSPITTALSPCRTRARSPRSAR